MCFSYQQTACIIQLYWAHLGLPSINAALFILSSSHTCQIKPNFMVVEYLLTNRLNVKNIYGQKNIKL